MCPRTSQFIPQTLMILLAGGIGMFILYFILSLVHCPLNVSLLIIFSLGLLVLFFLYLPFRYKSSLSAARIREGSTWISQQPGNVGVSKEPPKYFRHDFRLTKDDLGYIFQIFVTAMKGTNTTQNDTYNTRIEIYYDLENRSQKIINGSNVDKSFFDNVFLEDNSAAIPIQSLKIIMYNTNRPNSADISQITFEISKRNYASIRYYINGNNEAQINYLCNLLNSKISEIKYNLAGIPSILIGMSIIGLLVWVIMVLCFTYEFLSLSLSFPLGEIILIGLGLLLIIAYAVTYLSYSPSYNFYWGEYTTFFDRQLSKGQWIRSNAVGAAVGIIVTVIATYFTLTINIGPPGH